jgi:hypothetical protein
MKKRVQNAVEGLLVLTGIVLFISCGNEQRYEKHICTIDGVVRDCRIPVSIDGTPNANASVVIIVEPLATPIVESTPTATPENDCEHDNRNGKKCKKGES